MEAAVSLFDYSRVTIVATWIIAWVTHSVIIGAAAICGSRFMRRASARATLFRIALLLPIGSATIALSVRGGNNAPTSVQLQSRDVRPRVDVDVRQNTVQGKPVTTRHVRDALAERRAVALTSVFFVSAVIGLVLFALRIVQSRQKLRGRIRADALFAADLTNASGKVQRVEAMRITTSDALTSPVALPGREICVPLDFASVPNAERRAVLAHEVAHIERHDAEWSLFVDALVACSCLNPMSHVVRSHIRREHEMAADQIAIARGADRVALIGALQRFALMIERNREIAIAIPFVRRPSLTLARATALASPALIIPERQSQLRYFIVAISLCGAVWASLQVPLFSTVSAFPAGGSSAAHGANPGTIVKDEVTAVRTSP